MAKEFIERQRAIVDTCNSLELYPSEYAKLEDALNRIPAADVVEVRHGRWVHNEDYEDWAEKYVCSECNRNAPSDGDYRHGLTDFCPHCGAKMDKEE